jgi:hypothetical protein
MDILGLVSGSEDLSEIKGAGAVSVAFSYK